MRIKHYAAAAAAGAALVGAVLSGPGASASVAAPSVPVPGAAAASVARLAALTDATNPAPLVTTDYYWTGWRGCFYKNEKFADHSLVRWRIDFRHNKAGKRDAKKITYADEQGPLTVHTMRVREIDGTGPNIIAAHTWTVDSRFADRYAEPYMWWIPIAKAATMDTLLTLPDGDSCKRYDPMPVK